MTEPDFSQLKNESKLHITFDVFGQFLVGLLNRVAQHNRVFGEIFIRRNGTVQFEVFEVTGMKYISLFKRELYQMDPWLMHRKINTVILNETQEVDQLEQYLLFVWQIVQEKSPTLYGELEQLKLGPNLQFLDEPSNRKIGAKVEIRATSKEKSASKDKTSKHSSSTKLLQPGAKVPKLPLATGTKGRTPAPTPGPKPATAHAAKKPIQNQQSGTSLSTNPPQLKKPAPTAAISKPQSSAGTKTGNSKIKGIMKPANSSRKSSERLEVRA